MENKRAKNAPTKTVENCEQREKAKKLWYNKIGWILKKIEEKAVYA